MMPPPIPEPSISKSTKSAATSSADRDNAEGHVPVLEALKEAPPPPPPPEGAFLHSVL